MAFLSAYQGKEGTTDDLFGRYFDFNGPTDSDGNGEIDMDPNETTEIRSTCYSFARPEIDPA